MYLVEVPFLFLIPLFPLIGAFISGVFGATLQRRLGERAISVLTVSLPWLSFAVAALAVFTLAGAGPEAMVHQRLWSWFDVGSLRVDLAFGVDRLSAVMVLVVTFVGSLIHVYSMGYMRGDPGFWRFFSYLNLFMFSMLVLVLGDSLLLAFVGWEGVGLCSYLLIGFWYREPKNAVAGMKAFVVNRVGDAGFLLGMFLLFWGLGPDASTFERGPMPEPVAAHAAAHGEHGATAGAHEDGSGELAAAHGPSGHAAPRGAGKVERHAAGRAAHGRDAAHPAALEAAEGNGYPIVGPGPLPVRSVTFRELERMVVARPDVAARQWFGVSVLTLAALLLFVGAMGKSAQIPLYVWLPDAMAGPTPVSALIHAATMVTAGVYLVARMHFVFAMSPMAMTVVTTVGAVTALFAATIGVFQYDIKKVLAYSTVSQLGFMFVAVGVGAYWVGIFHLMTHAFFKACLFLGSGSVILGCHHEQDMRKMGGLAKLMPITGMTYLLSCFAIAGFPPFSGFFSKDEILWKAFDTGNLLLPGGGLIPWVLITTAALLTSFYMFRSYYLTFSGSYRGHGAKKHHDESAHDHDAHAHGHGGLPHESPASMTGVLGVLAVLAVVGGTIGLPLLWGLPNWFEHWLEPVFAGTHHRIVASGHGHGAEWALMGFSVLVAVSGFAAARWLYLDGKNPLPARLLASPSPVLRTVHRVVFNKYYVDELYDVTVVGPVKDTSEDLSWIDSRLVDGLVNACGSIGRFCGNLQGLIDRLFVDGLVNLVGDAVVNGGRALRRVQTGLIQAYLYVAVTGAVVLIVAVYTLR